MKKILCLSLVLILLLGLVGCDNSPKYEEFILYEANDAGEKFTAAELQNHLDISGQNLSVGDLFYLYLYDDGTAIICSFGNRYEMQYNDTEIWANDDSGVRATYTRAGDLITLFSDSLVLTYKKK